MERGRSGRSSALWGHGGAGKRSTLLAVILVFVFAGLMAVPANAAKRDKQAVVPSDLIAQAVANPNQLFNVIVTGRRGVSSANVGDEVTTAQRGKPGVARGTKRRFKLLNGDSATVSGAQLIELANSKKILTITPDLPTVPTDFSNTQAWPDAAQLTQYWSHASDIHAPTIAFIDSGIEASNPGFGGRVQTSVNLYSGAGQNSDGDGFGHGTFTAGVAAGAADGHAGGAPDANIVELDVLDDNGGGSTSDLIAACDWIQQNKAQYGIKVVNISVIASQNSTFMFDPLDKAVEKLWLNGLTVVTSAGNFANDGAQSGEPFAPANDPFVITVGASDTNNTADTSDDFAAPWTAWGPTNDGFMKPEISAPGRALVGPVPAAGSGMQNALPDRVTEPGYMWMSGTSFAAPVVSAAAAYVLAVHPDWTPDQVKGALMVSAADPAGYTQVGGLGVGEVQADAATQTDGTANPNLGLDQFVSADPDTGLNAFNSDTWQTTAQNDPTWNSMSWASMSWASASWSSMSWASMSWASMSWASMSWASMSWASMSWSSMSWASYSQVR
jgi:serine protease AprX